MAELLRKSVKRDLLTVKRKRPRALLEPPPTPKPKKYSAGHPRAERPPPTPPVQLPSFDQYQLLGSICRESFADFLKEFWHVVVPEKLTWNWHLKYLCDELQEMALRVFQGLPRKHDLIINISPGSSKSTIASIMFPAWCWTRMATCRIISASYAYMLSVDLSRKSRDVVKSELYQRCFPGIKIRDDQDAKGNFVNTQGGERVATGVDGSITGKHAHIIVVDDPLDPKMAASDADLNTANRWMQETLPSRKVDKRVTPIILIMQRLHEYDPTGMMLEKADRVPVKHICLPAEESDDIKPASLRRYYVDGLMDPERLSREVLAEAQSQGDYVYAGQYMQSPIPRGGAMFQVDKIEIEAPPPDLKMVKYVRYWDKAGTEGGGAFTVGTLMARDEAGHYWILDVERGQWDSGRRERVMRKTAIKDGRRVLIVVEQEPGSGGKDSASGTVRNLAGFRVRLHKVGKSDGDKIARADAFSSQVNNGNVSMVPAAWNKEFLNEYRFFPNSRYKDQVDSGSGAFNHLAGRTRRIGGLRRAG